jgi:hypothetical protein
LIKLFDPIKGKDDAIFLLNFIILSPKRQYLNIDLKLLKHPNLNLLPNLEDIPNRASNRLLIIDFQIAHLHRNLIPNEFIPQNFQMQLTQPTQQILARLRLVFVMKGIVLDGRFLYGLFEGV